MSDVLVKVENLSKKFCKNLKRSMLYGMQDIVQGTLGRSPKTDQLRPSEFWALDDISFELKRGECLGLIGPNGSGKSTLLKIINGILMPDRGHVEVNGKVGALIEIGAGFHPMLTGRENIYVNGSVLGFGKKEIDNKFDEIVFFSELEEFIDTPIKHYSSGMRVRLGFAIAAQMEPDILLIDEILAVGDIAFRSKCYSAIGELIKDSAVIFVSHHREPLIRICNKGVLLNRGENIFQGNIMNALNNYEQIAEQSLSPEKLITCYPPCMYFNIILKKSCINYGDDLKVEIIIELSKSVNNVYVRIVISNMKQQPCAEWNSKCLLNDISLKLGKQTLSVNMKSLMLRDGEYYVSVVLYCYHGKTLIGHAHQFNKFKIAGCKNTMTDYAIPAFIEGGLF